MARIIVNADDFGLNEKTNLAIYNAINSNLISNTSMLANMEGFDHALELIKSSPSISSKIGLHINLTQGKPLTKEIVTNSKFCTNGYFHGRIRETPVFHLNRKDKNHALKEISAQLNKIKEAGISISHVDGHHHIHTELGIFLSIKKILKNEGIKSMRISRTNSKQKNGLTTIFKQIYKTIFNNLIRLSGYKTTKYMGELEDFYTLKMVPSEIMVHFTESKTGEYFLDGDKKVNDQMNIFLSKHQLISFNEITFR